MCSDRKDKGEHTKGSKKRRPKKWPEIPGDFVPNDRSSSGLEKIKIKASHLPRVGDRKCKDRQNCAKKSLEVLSRKRRESTSTRKQLV